MVKVENGKIIVEIEIDTLQYALQYYNDQNSFYDDKPLELVDAEALAKDIALALEQEEEDGDTLVHHMFDKALEYAIEMGSEGIAWE